MEKIVLDTSVFIAAVLGSKGASRAVLQGCLEGRYLPLMGNALFQEYEEVLGREQLFKECVLNDKERNALLDALLSVCRWVTVYYAWRPNLRDEADNHLVELAVAGGATCIVTKNIKDFQDPELCFQGLRIVDPVRFIKEA